MDSYEYYLMYHEDSSSFFEALKCKSEEIIIALSKLLANKKFSSEKCFSVTWNWIRQEKQSNDKLSALFKALLTSERFEVVQKWTLVNIENFDETFVRILRHITEVSVSIEETEPFLKELSLKLMDLLYFESPFHAEIVSIIKLVMCSKPQIKKEVCERILIKSRHRNDHLALQTVCYFYEEIIQQEVFVIDCELLSRCFESGSTVARKQGIFLIKCLINHKILSQNEEANLTTFSIIAEALQESQHLILPALELIESIRFSEHFSKLLFLLLRMIISHESSIVKSWGLNYILKNESLEMNNEQIIVILNTLNSTSLYDDGEFSIEKNYLNKFIKRHFNETFRNLTEINWVSVPFYRILESICDEVEIVKKDEVFFDTLFLQNLQKQTEMIPRRIKNLVIRSGVQKKYIRITTVVAQTTGLKPLKQLLENIFNMGETYEGLEECLRCASMEDLKSIVSFDLEKNFLKFVMLTIATHKGFDDVILLSVSLEDRKKLNMITACQIRNNNQGLQNYVNAAIRETTKNIFDNADKENSIEFVDNVEILTHGLQSANNVATEVQSSLIDIWRLMKNNTKVASTNREAFWNILLLILQFNENVDTSSFLDDVFNKSNKSSLVLVRCQFLILQEVQRQNIDLDQIKVLQFVTNLSHLVDECFLIAQMNSIIKFIKSVVADELFISKVLRNHFQGMIMLTDVLINTVLSIDERKKCIGAIMEILLMLAELDDIAWINHITRVLKSMMKNLTTNEKANVLNVIINSMKHSRVLQNENSLRNFIKTLLIEKALETEMMTKDQQ